MPNDASKPIKPSAPVNNTVNAQITVNATPGQNPQDIAQAVAKELEKQQRQLAAQQRSRLIDEV